MSSSITWAQNQPPTTYAVPVPPVIQQLYAAADTIPSALYNGPEYANYALRNAVRVGHQFFVAPDLLPGSVVYNKQPFDNLQLLYDLVLDQLIVRQPTNPQLLRLLNEKLSRFTIAGYHFEQFQADSTAGVLPATGYYEVLTEGSVRLLARRAKYQQTVIDGRLVKVEFVPNDRLYAYRAGRYYSINSRSAMWKLLADREPQLRAYMRQNKIKLDNKRFEYGATLLINYYNQLSAG